MYRIKHNSTILTDYEYATKALCKSAVQDEAEKYAEAHGGDITHLESGISIVDDNGKLDMFAVSGFEPL